VRVVTESKSSTRHGYDIPGAVTVTLGLLALVYGFTTADTHGWTAPITLGLLAAAAALLASFVTIELRTAHPLLPMRVLLERNRGGSFLASLLVGVALLGTFLSLTFYFQGTLGFSAMKTGLAFVPFSIGIIAGAATAGRVLPRLGPRAILTGGIALGALGLLLFTRIGVHSAYLSVALPAELITSFGMGMTFVAMNSTSLIGVHPEDAGVASALVNSTQQTGGTMGAALTNTIASTATVGYLAAHGTSAASVAAGAVHGYTMAFTFSAVVLALAGLAAFTLVRHVRGPVVDPLASIVPETDLV
jgi:predicted MFS family arabinose efflux permease